jgi:hypothetical protein
MLSAVALTVGGVAGTATASPGSNSTAGHAAPGAPAAPTDPVCRTLYDLQTGKIIPSEVGEFDQVADMLGRLIAVADDPLKSDLTQMKQTFAAIGEAQAAGQSVVPAFTALTAPTLIDVEQHIADDLTNQCGPVLAPPATSSDTGDLAGSVCPGWTSQANIYTSNRFPFTIDTSGANYWGFNTPTTPGGSVVLQGQYPFARYFSILPNDFQTNNLHQQTDAFIDPDPGSANPFRGPIPKGAGRNYTVKFVFSAPPANPEPNTSYVGATKDGQHPNPYVLFVYRIYGSLLGDTPNSGGEPLPAITYYDANGNVTAHYDECTPYPNGTPPAPAHVQRFPTLPIPGPRAAAKPVLSLSSNYHVPVDLLANPDVQYASVFYSHRLGDLLVIHAKALSTPDTAGGQPVYATGKDARGFTVCGYNFYAGYANRCLMDHQLAVDKHGYYTIVISTLADKPKNATRANHVNWIDWGPYLDGQMTYRLFLRSQPKVAQLAAAIESGHATKSIAAYVPQMSYCSVKTFQHGGWHACSHR